MSLPARAALAVGGGLILAAISMGVLALPDGTATVPRLSIAGLVGFAIGTPGTWALMFMTLGAVHLDEQVAEMTQAEERVFQFPEQDWVEPVRDGDELRYVIRYRGRRRHSGPIEAIAERVVRRGPK